jgi:hypothetical protein
MRMYMPVETLTTIRSMFRGRLTLRKLFTLLEVTYSFDTGTLCVSWPFLVELSYAHLTCKYPRFGSAWTECLAPCFSC